MAILEILQYPHPVLAEKAQPVQEITQEIKDLVNDMVETMYASRGVGLAAPQIGKSIRLIVMDPSGPDEKNDLRVLINPELSLLGEVQISPMEGCLSVPFDYRADVKRHDKVRVKATDLENNPIDIEWDDFEAIVIQHEYDHLEGTLFIDHIGRLRRSLFETRVKKSAKRNEA